MSDATRRVSLVSVINLALENMRLAKEHLARAEECVAVHKNNLIISVSALIFHANNLRNRELQSDERLGAVQCFNREESFQAATGRLLHVAQAELNTAQQQVDAIEKDLVEAERSLAALLPTQTTVTDEEG